MCGIFGWQFAKKVPSAQKQVMAAVMSVHMDERGGHGWGLYDVTTAKLRKGLGYLSDGPRHRYFSTDSLFAHTRFGTTGGKVKRNAHPFRLGDIVGCHNGMVSNHAELNWAYDRECEVDSQHLLLHIRDGLDLEEINAYGTVVFVMDGGPDVFMGKFNQGDLAVYRVGDKGLVWASTDTAVKHALRFAGLDGIPIKVEEGILYMAAGGKLWETEHRLTCSPYVSKVFTNYRSVTSGGSVVGTSQYETDDLYDEEHLAAIAGDIEDAWSGRTATERDLLDVEYEKEMKMRDDRL